MEISRRIVLPLHRSLDRKAHYALAIGSCRSCQLLRSRSRETNHLVGVIRKPAFSTSHFLRNVLVQVVSISARVT